MDPLTSLKILRFLRSKDPYIFKVVRLFFEIKERDRSERFVEISSESMGKADTNALRVALTCMKSAEAIELLDAFHLNDDIQKYMFDNFRDDCFGLGFAEYADKKAESRFKLYNYYHRSKKKINIGMNLRRIAGLAKINFGRIKRDHSFFKKVRMAAIDFYPDGKQSLKVYYGPFLTRELFRKFTGVLKEKAARDYARYFQAGRLPQLFLFCVRYTQKERSVRTDFWYDTYGVLGYLRYFDTSCGAKKLYAALKNIGKPKLTFVCIDRDRRPRTQFYFDMS